MQPELEDQIHQHRLRLSDTLVVIVTDQLTGILQRERRRTMQVQQVTSRRPVEGRLFVGVVLPTEVEREERLVDRDEMILGFREQLLDEARRRTLRSCARAAAADAVSEARSNVRPSAFAMPDTDDGAICNSRAIAFLGVPALISSIARARTASSTGRPWAMLVHLFGGAGRVQGVEVSLGWVCGSCRWCLVDWEAQLKVGEQEGNEHVSS